MTTFERHIIRRLLFGFCLLTLVLVVFFVVLHYLEYVDDFFDLGASMRMVFLEYYPSYIPEIMKLTSPLALFLSCVFLTGKLLAQETQIVALTMGGVSPFRFLRPYFLTGVLLTGFMFWFNGWIVPEANQNRIAFENQYLKNSTKPVDTREIQLQNSPGHLLTVGFYDYNNEVGHQVSLLSFDDQQRLVRRLDASTMTWVDSLRLWRFQNGIEYRMGLAGKLDRMQRAQVDTTLNLKPRDLARTVRDTELLTIPAAKEYIETLLVSGAGQIERPLVDYYGKIAYPFANLILILVGVPLASVKRRGGQAVQIGIGLIIAFVYLAFIKLSEPFGYSGTLSPLATAWLPHLTFLLFGLVLLVRRAR